MEGESIQNVISVGMLSEGWDAKTVTHIMGLRAFTSQLLCEQVVGRGLRRTSYDEMTPDGRFEPEYVNIFGVPFTFLPHEGGSDGPPPPPKPKTTIEPVVEKAEFEISWPNVVRIDHAYRARLTVDWAMVEPLEIDASRTAQLAELAPIVEGKPDIANIAPIKLEELAREFRLQRNSSSKPRAMYTIRCSQRGAADDRCCLRNWYASSSSSSVQTESSSLRTVPAGRPEATPRNHTQHDFGGPTSSGRRSATPTPSGLSQCSTATAQSAQPATCALGTPVSRANTPPAAI